MDNHRKIAMIFLERDFVQHQEKHVQDLIKDLQKYNSYFVAHDDTLRVLLYQMIEKNDLVNTQADALTHYFSEKELKLLLDMEKYKKRNKSFSKAHYEVQSKYLRLREKLRFLLLQYLNGKFDGKLTQ